MYRSWILFDWIPRPIRLFAAWLFTRLSMAYVGVCFKQGGFTNFLNFARSTHYLFLWLLPILLIGIKISGIVRYAKKLEKEANSENEEN